MLDTKDSLLSVLAQLATSETTVTLRSLFSEALLSGLDLEKIQTLDSACKRYNLEFVPALTHGDLDSPRRLNFRLSNEITRESAMKEIQGGESQRLEFKSSLWFDRQRAEFSPGTPLSELKSDPVLHAALKSVAALMNTQGGILYIGIRDDGEPLGIEADYTILKSEKRSTDGFELTLRDLIKDRFYRGNAINDSVAAKFIMVGEEARTIARIEILPGPQLAFLRGPRDQSYHLYRRQGNRTTEVRIEEFEDFLAARRKQNFV